jgi:hypothetical protein
LPLLGYEVDTVSMAVLPSPGTKQGTFFEDLDLSGGASSASARKDRRSPRAKRIADPTAGGGRPDAQEEQGAGRLFCVKC